MLHISLYGETLFYLGSFAVTSTLLTTWIVIFFLAIFAINVRNRYTSQGKKLSKYLVFIEMIIGGLYNLFHGVLGKSTKTLFPLLATFFIFIIISNWSGLLPGVGTIGIVHDYSHDDSYDTSSDDHALLMQTAYAAESSTSDLMEDDHSAGSSAMEVYNEGNEYSKDQDNALFSMGNVVVYWQQPDTVSITPILRAPTADLNTTIALAVIAVVFMHVYATNVLGAKAHFGKFISFKSPIAFFVGILEAISELGKIISFAFRLFGNIFAGEVLLVVIAFLIPLLAPIPFLGLEIFVGFIQALVFTMLLAVFINVATQHVEH